MLPDSRRIDRWWRVVVGTIVLVSCLRAWVGPDSTASLARAQIPDSGTQRLELIGETKRTNQLLSEIKQLLKAGTLKVRLEGADNPSELRPRKR